MVRKRFTPILVTYIFSLVVAVALLVMWVVFVVQSRARLAEMGGRLQRQNLQWVALAVGCSLAGLLIAGLVYQLAQALAARRYAEKQEEFVSNITHEMKSPLAGIKLHAQTLQQEGLSAEQQQRSVAYILADVDRMSTLVDNVLESSRLLARKKLLVLQPVSLGEFLPDFFARIRPRVEGHDVQLTVVGGTEAWVAASEDALDRVLTNLIENAVRFSARGGEVRCRLGEEAQKVVIEVEDDGVGIPKGELKKIFDRFYQIGREISDRRRGTGLGLAIVSGLVREMKGSVRAFSQEGRPGTRFRVELPKLEGAV